MKKQFTYIAAAFLVSGMLTAQKIDINKMPTPGPTPVINISKPQSFQLKNGLTVMIVENHKLPRVNMSLSMDRPPIYEGTVAGVADVMADQFENGTMTMSKFLIFWCFWKYPFQIFPTSAQFDERRYFES